MAALLSVFVAIFAVFYQQCSAQIPNGLGGLFGGNNMMGGTNVMGQQQRKAYRTCVGQTAAGDEMRVTFSQSRARSSNWWDANDLEIDATIKSASISGRFRLVTTQFGRIDGMCESENLGTIIRGQQQRQPFSAFNFGWYNQAPMTSNIGEVGTAFDLTPGQSVKIQDNINSELNFDIISGGGMALCPVTQILNNKCLDMISLCCAIAKDRQSATTIPMGAGMRGMNGMSGMNGMQGMNSMSGMNGMQGMNSMSGMNGMSGQMNGMANQMPGQIGGSNTGAFPGRK